MRTNVALGEPRWKMEEMCRYAAERLSTSERFVFWAQLLHAGFDRVIFHLRAVAEEATVRLCDLRSETDRIQQPSGLTPYSLSN